MDEAKKRYETKWPEKGKVNGGPGHEIRPLGRSIFLFATIKNRSAILLLSSFEFIYSRPLRIRVLNSREDTLLPRPLHTGVYYTRTPGNSLISKKRMKRGKGGGYMEKEIRGRGGEPGIISV